MVYQHRNWCKWNEPLAGCLVYGCLFPVISRHFPSSSVDLRCLEFSRLSLHVGIRALWGVYHLCFLVFIFYNFSICLFVVMLRIELKFRSQMVTHDLTRRLKYLNASPSVVFNVVTEKRFFFFFFFFVVGLNYINGSTDRLSRGCSCLPCFPSHPRIHTQIYITLFVNAWK